MISLKISYESHVVGLIILLVLQMRKLRHREGRWLA